MCGVTGIFDVRRSRDVDSAVLHRMDESRFHRGSEEGSLHVEPGIGLRYRYLYIGHRPLCDEDQIVSLVTNGEIYTYRELNPDFRTPGTLFTLAALPKSPSMLWSPGVSSESSGCVAFSLLPSGTATATSSFWYETVLGGSHFYSVLNNGRFLSGSKRKSFLFQGRLSRKMAPLAAWYMSIRAKVPVRAPGPWGPARSGRRTRCWFGERGSIVLAPEVVGRVLPPRRPYFGIRGRFHASRAE